MADRPTAEEQLARILQIVPRLARRGGTTISDAAAVAGVDERELIRDLEEVYTRAYYRPGAWVDDIHVSIEPDRVEVRTTGEFRRPPRFSPRESLVTALGLRMLSYESGESTRSRCQALAERLEKDLFTDGGTDDADRFGIGPGAAARAEIRAALAGSARERRRCRIRYLKPGADKAEERDVDPYVLLVAGDRWYAVGFCHARRGPRVFRLDRILDASPLDDRFEVPEDFDPDEYVADGRVYRADEFEEVTVRYSARIARWIEEQGPVERLDDGAVLVRYSVADPAWAVRHALEHAPEAEILAPESIRSAVADGARRVFEAGSV